MRPATRKSLLLTAAATLGYGGALWGQFNWTRTSWEAEGGGFLLELTSHHRSVTRFNFYTALWGHLIMADIQARILEVIKRRCEGKRPA